MGDTAASRRIPDGPVVQGFPLGPFETNCYVVRASGGGEGGHCWIVDASFDPRAMIHWVRQHALHPSLLILTHAHLDHIAGVADVLRSFPGLPVLIHEAEAAWLGNPILNLSAMGGMPVTAPGPDRLLHDGDLLDLGSSRWEVIHTPGHSPGGITLHDPASGQALVGDALFAGSIGRTDFPGSDHHTLEQSIRQRLYRLPDHTRIYPGHGPPSTIGQEKRHNPFVRG